MLAGEAPCLASGFVSLDEVVASDFPVVLSGAQRVPGGGDHALDCRYGGLVRPPPRSETAVSGDQVGVFFALSGAGRSDQSFA